MPNQPEYEITVTVKIVTTAQHPEQHQRVIERFQRALELDFVHVELADEPTIRAIRRSNLPPLRLATEPPQPDAVQRKFV